MRVLTILSIFALFLALGCGPGEATQAEKDAHKDDFAAQQQAIVDDPNSGAINPDADPSEGP